MTYLHHTGNTPLPTPPPRLHTNSNSISFIQQSSATQWQKQSTYVHHGTSWYKICTTYVHDGIKGGLREELALSRRHLSLLTTLSRLSYGHIGTTLPASFGTSLTSPLWSRRIFRVHGSSKVYYLGWVTVINARPGLRYGKWRSIVVEPGTHDCNQLTSSISRISIVTGELAPGVHDREHRSQSLANIVNVFERAARSYYCICVHHK